MWEKQAQEKKYIPYQHPLKEHGDGALSLIYQEIQEVHMKSENGIVWTKSISHAFYNWIEPTQ